MFKGIIANPNVAPHIKQNVKALFEGKILYKIYTSFYYHHSYPLAILLGFLSKKLKLEIKRRSLDELPYQLISGKPTLELFRTLSSKIANAKITDKIWNISELSFDNWVSKKLKNNIDFIFVCEHSSLKTLIKAKSMSIKSFYEQPSIHHTLFTNIINQQFSAYPELVNDTIRLADEENSRIHNLRRDRELALSDYIICNSSFTRESLVNAGIDKEKIIIIPLGFPEVKDLKIIKKNSKFIFMYAGNLTMNKGIHILLEAWKEIHHLFKEAELHLYGTYFLPAFLKENLPETIHFFGNIPHHNLIEAYRSATVFVNPTLADGFGMVTAEAMANGLLVIASKNSAAPDLITHELDGLLINAGDKEQLKEKMMWSFENPAKINQMAINALEKAKKYTWADYRTNLVETINSKLSND